MPLIYTPNGTFIFRTSYDYYQNEEQVNPGQTEQAYKQKLSIDTSMRFWRVFELSGLAKAVDYQLNNTSVRNSDYDATASIKGYLYDFDEFKLIPTVSYRQIESRNDSENPLIRLDRMLTLTGYVSLKLNKNVLISGLVSEDVMLNWYRNDAYPETTRIDYDKHSHILNAAMGVTVWY
jgi:hypothetical protein